MDCVAEEGDGVFDKGVVIPNCIFRRKCSTQLLIFVFSLFNLFTSQFLGVSVSAIIIVTRLITVVIARGVGVIFITTPVKAEIICVIISLVAEQGIFKKTQRPRKWLWA